MTALVLAEHNNQELLPATLNAIAAAAAIGGDIDVLVAGADCRAVADAAAAVAGVRKVLHVEGEQYAHALAEEIAPLIVSV
ncbi:MAG: electron transfer flavoprotein subunit alpha/FixB family protein, partial [Gammaproteobacteria bacterium]